MNSTINSTATPVPRKVYTVSRLNQEVHGSLERTFGLLWLEGELSNFSRPGSGHFYFSIKDSRSQIRCAMFKGRNRYLDFDPQSGDAVVVRGKLGLYSARGDFQLIVEHMEPAGAGRLQAEFEATKRRLDEQGWFSDSEKLALPSTPAAIGVVTSPTGAALQDVLQVLGRRYRQADIIIYPTLTQGKKAAPAIAEALRTANRRNEADVLLLVRGGGSLEDLWAFNEIIVATAIRDSQIAIVSGIGHEIDVTISDLVADLRAPTPSAAAELVAPDNSALSSSLEKTHYHLVRLQQQLLTRLKLRFEQQQTRLQLRHPQRLLREQAQKVDDLTLRLQLGFQNIVQQLCHRQRRLTDKLQSLSPATSVQRQKTQRQMLKHRLDAAISHRCATERARFDSLARTLHSVSPLAVLDRGYAVVKKDDQVIVDIENVDAGDKISARVSNGEIIATVSSRRVYTKT